MVENAHNDKSSLKSENSLLYVLNASYIIRALLKSEECNAILDGT